MSKGVNGFDAGEGGMCARKKHLSGAIKDMGHVLLFFCVWLQGRYRVTGVYLDLHRRPSKHTYHPFPSTVCLLRAESTSLKH